MVPIGNDTGLIVTMELAFPGIIPILFASASVNQKSPFWSSVLYREYAPGTGMVNSSIFPVAGSRRPILFARCSANHNRPRPSIVKVAGAVAEPICEVGYSLKVEFEGMNSATELPPCSETQIFPFGSATIQTG